MNRTILYYPTINIPRRSWLKHALLYWDEVSSIVPKSYNDDILINLSTDIHYLIQEEQFRPIKPEDLIFAQDNWQAFDEFQTEFKSVITDRNFKNFQNRGLRTSSYRIHENKVNPNYTSRIHSNKTSDSIYYFLEELGLAQRENGQEWIMFERNTALLYMSLLAKYLADIDSEHTTIGTDYAAYEKFNFKRVGRDSGFPVTSFNLHNILPTPKENVPLEKIIQFKRKRADNLTHFKKTISDFQTKISNSKSNSELKETAINFQDDLTKGVKDLVQVMGDSKIESVLKTFKSLINLKSPTLLATAGAVINENYDFLHLPMDLTKIGIGAMGAIELTTKYIEQRNKVRAELRNSSFSYLYYARNNGIINRRR